MKCLVGVCLIAAILSVAPAGIAQSAAEIPMQRGISVDMPVTANAAGVPEADKEDAVVVAITRAGNVYLGVNPIKAEDLSEQVRAALSKRTDKTIYIKADAHVPYANVVKVLDAVRPAGAEGVTFLTRQRDAGETGTLVPPKGLEMRVGRAKP